MRLKGYIEKYILKSKKMRDEKRRVRNQFFKTNVSKHRWIDIPG